MIFKLNADDYEQLKSYSKVCEFQSVLNPVDDVEYPFICEHIPEKIEQSLELKVSELMAKPIKFNYLFLRMSPAGVHVPHPVHHDGSMGNYSMMLYLFDRPNSGTAFVKHATGIDYASDDANETELIIADQSNFESWTVESFVQAEENKGFIFDAKRLHAALPVGGFGDNQDNARIVCTGFFS